jgi:hypothetical protein
MADKVMDKILDGELEVRGRRPGQVDYEPIPRTHWRSSAFYVDKDQVALWKIVICPRGGVRIDPDGSIHAEDAVAAQRTAMLDYDSYLVDGYQFETLWPRREVGADAEIKKLLK